MTDHETPEPQLMQEPDTAGFLIASDLIEKVNAGAALVHGLYLLPMDTLRAALDKTAPALLDNTCIAFRAIYDHALTVYGFEGNE